MKSNGHFFWSLVEDTLSQPIFDKEQSQGLQAVAQVQGNLENSEENTVVLQHPLNIISYMTVTLASTTNKFQQIHHRQEPTHQILIHDQHYTTVFAPMSVITNEIDSDVSIRSRCTQEGLMLSTDGTSGRGTTVTWSAGVGTEVHDQRAPFCERKRTGETTHGLRKDEPEPTGRESTTAADSSCRETHERTPDQVDKGRPYATVDAEGLGLPGFRQARSQDLSRSSTDGSRRLQLGR